MEEPSLLGKAGKVNPGVTGEREARKTKMFVPRFNVE